MRKYLPHPVPLLFYITVLLLGMWVRLDQFLAQVLIDDEWHAVHQLILHKPRDILLSFGYADHSIPLTLMYWLEASWFGLSELGMRWPMMLCGLATLLLFPLYVWRTLGQREAILFALMLAISPMLVIYSQTARPYAVTLFLVYIAHFAFHRYCSNASHRFAYGALYGFSAVLATWLHLIAGPFVVAPFLYEGISMLRAKPSERGARLRQALLLGLPTVAGMLLLVLPPLLANSAMIRAKSGADSPNWQTITGVWYSWIGTPSSTVILILLALAIIGIPKLWRELFVVRSALLGLALALSAILIMQPAWVHHSITFGRYLLPAIPLLLLSVAAGTVRLADAFDRQRWQMRRYIMAAILFVPPLLLAVQTPLLNVLRRPNTNVTHSVYSFDFRPEHNLILKRFHKNVPLSAYWSQLATLPHGSLRIAVAPFYFESYNWDAPRWERNSRQTIIPGYLSGLCSNLRPGEVPKIEFFKFRNAVFLNDLVDISAHKINLIVYQKPYMVMEDDGTKHIMGEDTSHCERVMRTRFGTPQYEDDKILVFPIISAGITLSYAE